MIEALHHLRVLLLSADPFIVSWGLLNLLTVPSGLLLARELRRGRLVSPVAWLVLPSSGLCAAAVLLFLLGSPEALTRSACATPTFIATYAEGPTWLWRIVEWTWGTAALTAAGQGALAGWVWLRHGRRLPPPVARSALGSAALCLGVAALLGLTSRIASEVSWTYAVGGGWMGQPERLAETLGVLRRLGAAWSGVAVVALWAGGLTLRGMLRASAQPRQLALGLALAGVTFGLCQGLGVARLLQVHGVTHWGAWARALELPYALPSWPEGTGPQARVLGTGGACALDAQGWTCVDPARPGDDQAGLRGVLLAPATLPLSALLEVDAACDEWLDLLVCEAPLVAPRGLWERAFPPAVLGCNGVRLEIGRAEVSEHAVAVRLPPATTVREALQAAAHEGWRPGSRLHVDVRP